MLISRLVFLLLLLVPLLALRRPARTASMGRATVPIAAPTTLSPRSFSSGGSPGEQDPQPLLQPEDSDEVLIRRIRDEVMAESGVELDQLINPSKVEILLLLLYTQR